MSEDSELLGQLRRARSGRDAARHEVYESRLEILGLTRAQERAGRGDEQDPDTRGALDAARERLARRKGLLSERERPFQASSAGCSSARRRTCLVSGATKRRSCSSRFVSRPSSRRSIGARNCGCACFRMRLRSRRTSRFSPPRNTRREWPIGKRFARRPPKKPEKPPGERWPTCSAQSSRLGGASAEAHELDTPPPAAGVDLAFPNVPLTKPDSWSQAPHSIVMPDRLLLMFFRGNTLVQTIPGKPINDYVVLGLRRSTTPARRRSPGPPTSISSTARTSRGSGLS